MLQHRQKRERGARLGVFALDNRAGEVGFLSGVDSQAHKGSGKLQASGKSRQWQPQRSVDSEQEVYLKGKKGGQQSVLASPNGGVVL